MKKFFSFLMILAAFTLAAEIVTVPLMANSQQNIVQTSNENIQEASVSPILAAVLSLLVPGLGQIVLGKVMRGVMFLLGWIVALVVIIALTAVTLGIGSFLGCCLILINVWAAFDAYNIAKKGDNNSGDDESDSDDDVLLNTGITPVFFR